MCRWGVAVKSIFPELGFRVPAMFKRSTTPAGHTALNTAPVVLLDKSFFPQASREASYRAQRVLANASNLR